MNDSNEIDSLKSKINELENKIDALRKETNDFRDNNTKLYEEVTEKTNRKIGWIEFLPLMLVLIFTMFLITKCS